jgi:hypothetical protein
MLDHGMEVRRLEAHGKMRKIRVLTVALPFHCWSKKLVGQEILSRYGGVSADGSRSLRGLIHRRFEIAPVAVNEITKSSSGLGFDTDPFQRPLRRSGKPSG